MSSNQGDSCPSSDITTISSITILMYKKGKEVMKYRSTIWLLYPLAMSTLLALEFVFLYVINATFCLLLRVVLLAMSGYCGYQIETRKFLL